MGVKRRKLWRKKIFSLISGVSSVSKAGNFKHQFPLGKILRLQTKKGKRGYSSCQWQKRHVMYYAHIYCTEDFFNTAC